jgi:hypothetical protein
VLCAYCILHAATYAMLRGVALSCVCVVRGACCVLFCVLCCVHVMFMLLLMWYLRMGIASERGGIHVVGDADCCAMRNYGVWWIVVEWLLVTMRLWADCGLVTGMGRTCVCCVVCGCAQCVWVSVWVYGVMGVSAVGACGVVWRWLRVVAHTRGPRKRCVASARRTGL